MTARIVDILDETDIGLNKVIFATGVDIFEVCLDALSLLFSAAQEVDSWLFCLFGKLSECGLADPACRAHEDCDEPSRETGADEGIRSTYQLE